MKHISNEKLEALKSSNSVEEYIRAVWKFDPNAKASTLDSNWREREIYFAKEKKRYDEILKKKAELSQVCHSSPGKGEPTLEETSVKILNALIESNSLQKEHIKTLQVQNDFLAEHLIKISTSLQKQYDLFTAIESRRSK
jgi:hypothetical protein